MIRNIIFDFGNVFIEWNPRLVFQPIIPGKDLDHFMQTVWRDEWNSNLDSGISFVENEQILSAKYPQHKEYIAYFHQHWYDSLNGENPESIALLADVQQAGYATYGLSNWPAETFPPTMEAHPFFKTLKGIVLSGVEKVCKPDPGIYQILLERYQLIPGECVFIDDRQENLDTAQKLGIETILFQTAGQVRECLRSQRLGVAL
ncbi:MAG: HAD family phosphatase [Dysgonamonadaceae bacterium]|jgi:2-haloacid dehalogenase|nr:HAD family phosphatase [Dysgonamonadaceae bacterium]